MYILIVLKKKKKIGEGNGNPLQYSCLENSMDRGAWQAIVHGVAKNHTQLSNRAHAHTHIDRSIDVLCNEKFYNMSS